MEAVARHLCSSSVSSLEVRRRNLRAYPEELRVLAGSPIRSRASDLLRHPVAVIPPSHVLPRPAGSSRWAARRRALHEARAGLGGRHDAAILRADQDPLHRPSLSGRRAHQAGAGQEAGAHGAEAELPTEASTAGRSARRRRRVEGRRPRWVPGQRGLVAVSVVLGRRRLGGRLRGQAPAEEQPLQEEADENEVADAAVRHRPDGPREPLAGAPREARGRTGPVVLHVQGVGHGVHAGAHPLGEPLRRTRASPSRRLGLRTGEAARECHERHYMAQRPHGRAAQAAGRRRMRGEPRYP
mmetsp:Transcript_107085/g.333785  ORF Transcript_107085/g.333785 Transcript_107085/m.333785 type:complete len:298 (+) Transcript_107085:539-1432(+)